MSTIDGRLKPIQSTVWKLHDVAPGKGKRWCPRVVLECSYCKVFGRLEEGTTWGEVLYFQWRQTKFLSLPEEASCKIDFFYTQQDFQEDAKKKNNIYYCRMGNRDSRLITSNWWYMTISQEVRGYLKCCSLQYKKRSKFMPYCQVKNTIMRKPNLSMSWTHMYPTLFYLMRVWIDLSYNDSMSGRPKCITIKLNLNLNFKFCL